MNIDDLKSDWKNAGTTSLTDNEVAAMVKIRNHPILGKIRMKLIIESIFLILLLTLYYDGFDGDKKPFIVNLLLVGSAILYLSNNLIGYLFIKNNKAGSNMKEAINIQINKLKKMASFSILSSIVYGISLLVFFASDITFDQRKYIIISGLVIFFIFMFYFSYLEWQRKINYFKQMESEF